MSKDKLIPELRFPEFVGDEAWVENEVGKIFRFKQGVQVAVENQYPVQQNGMVRFIRIIDITSNAEPPRYIENPGNDHIFEENDLFMIRYGTPGLVSFGFNGVIANNLFRLIWNVEEDFVGKYWFYSFQNLEKKIYTLSGSSSMPAISFSTLDNLNISHTKSPQEQQKIASCLSSLDELLAAHNEKLDALKDHKKGLMQNLFPQEGETVPKVRFSEFEGDGDWVEKSIQKLIDDKIIIGHLDGNHGALYPKASEFSEEGVPYITANDFASGLIDFAKCKHLPMQRAKKFKKGVAKDGDILFAHNATVGPVAKLVTDLPFVILSTTATYYRCDNKVVINDFLKFALTSPFFVGQYTRVMSQSTRNQVPITTQRKFHLHLPKPREQQKIASCLSALDELINAQADKIEQLQQHKKGLMQGLFPKIES